MYCHRLFVQHRFRRVLNVPAIFVAMGVPGLALEANAQSPNDGLPIPATTKDSLTAIQRTFELPAPPPLALFPQMREQMKDTPAFLRDSKVSLTFAATTATMSEVTDQDDRQRGMGRRWRWFGQL